MSIENAVQPPPSYDNVLRVVVTVDDEVEPPTYSNFMTRLRDAQRNGETPTSFAKETLKVLLRSIPPVICLLLSIVLPIAMVVIGAMHFNECKANPNIPIWLIVSGCIYTFFALLTIAAILSNIQCSNSSTVAPDVAGGNSRLPKFNTNRFSKIVYSLNSVVCAFLTSWFIVGNVWVYGISNSVKFDEHLSSYCNEALYFFSFWVVTGSWILLGVSFVCCFWCLLLIFLYFCFKD